MKDFVKRWISIGNPSKREFEDLAASAVEALAKAKDAHISDLRLLIDKGHEREAELSGLVRMAMESKFYRPEVNSGKPPENRVSAGLPVEHMQDVAVYDEAEDAEMMRAQENELKELIAEQNEQGSHKVTA